ncbi:DUF6438 domain-containing protein [Burkholderia vietnamiensis]|uniref:DUF6438 domain-containing protein n=1 Tax=Burkholderia vietnamiensis TaxID=60552 RepID=UPI001D14F9DA|nr:DUF6438 domain-containing protein [Burkholderia vietnamiensis]UEC01713.1 DUF6438 domain-containing protein [Burkholderia vietnamiensis]
MPAKLIQGANENLKAAFQRKEFRMTYRTSKFMSLLALTASVSIVPVLSACAGYKSEGIESITVSTGPCFGYCPVYDLTIHSDGQVRFHGERHTMLLGDRELQRPPAKYKEASTLLEPFRPADASVSETKCDRTITDSQTYEITWTSATGQKTVLRHDRGCLSAQNERLNQVLDQLPALLGVEDLSKQITRPGVSRG